MVQWYMSTAFLKHTKKKEGLFTARVHQIIDLPKPHHSKIVDQQLHATRKVHGVEIETLMLAGQLFILARKSSKLQDLLSGEEVWS